MEDEPGLIMVRGLFLRMGDLEMTVREDGSMLIIHGSGQRLELSQTYAGVLAGMMKMVTRG